MPWKETGVMEQRLAFVEEALRGDECKAELCRRYGISRPTGDKWLKRFMESGRAGLEDRSCAPRSHPNQVPDGIARAILDLRCLHMAWGPRKLVAYLRGKHPDVSWPAASTVGDLLARSGLAVPRTVRRRTPPFTRPFAECAGPNDVWCADFKGWFRTGDGRRCEPLTISDAFSRLLLRCQVLEGTSGGLVQPVFEAAFREYGLPGAMRTDNGAPFASRGVGGLSALSIWWLRLGIVPERIRPGKPQENGRHERMHQTLKREAASPPSATLREQQRRLTRFRRDYNEERPHEALGQRPPACFHAPSPRRYPSRLPEPDYGDEAAVRSVRHNGEIKWRGHNIFLGEALVGQRVGLRPMGDGTWLVCFCVMPLGVLDERRRKPWRIERAKGMEWPRTGALAGPFRSAPGAGQSSDV